MASISDGVDAATAAEPGEPAAASAAAEDQDDAAVKMDPFLEQMSPADVMYADGMSLWRDLNVLFAEGNDGMFSPWRKPTNEGEARKVEQMVKLFGAAAKLGHAIAMCHLGNMHQDGQGVPVDLSLAAEWIRKSAEKGYGGAQTNLGLMYQQGCGVEQSDATAAEWYRKAAFQGVALAQHNLGLMYQQGQGVEQSDSMAMGWYRKAADQGLPPAQANLHKLESMMREHGSGVANSSRTDGAHAPPDPNDNPGSSGAVKKESTDKEWYIEVGNPVVLHSLKARPELNGQSGVVTGFVVAEKRIAVTLDDGRGPFKLRPENLHNEELLCDVPL